MHLLFSALASIFVIHSYTVSFGIDWEFERTFPLSKVTNVLACT